MMKETVLSRSLRMVFASGVAAGMGLIALPVAAQTTEGTPQRVEITGSAIKRIQQEGALPVQVISKETIERTGATTVADLIQKLPAMQGFTIEAIAAGTNSGGRTSASIHDLGGDYTLVLINGRRVAPQGDGSNVNLAMIPMSAIERVEVLTDGASALYGSDAIAGVVNFILKKTQKGGDIEATYTSPQHPGAKNWNVNASYGFGDLEENGYSAVLSYRHDDQQKMKAVDRPYSKTAFIPFTWNGTNYFYDRTSTSTIPANATVRFTDNTSTAFSPWLKKNGNCPTLNFVSINNSALCAFDFGATVEVVPESKRDSLFASGQMKLGNGMKLFSDIALTRMDLTAVIAANPVPVSIPTSSQYYKDYVLPYLTATQAGKVKSVTANYRAYDWGGRTSNTITEGKHFVIGLDGELMGWDFNSAITASRNEIDERYTNGYMLAKEFGDMLATRAFDPFAPIGGQSDATKDLIAKSIFHGSIRTASTDLRGFDVRGSRELFKLPGGASQLAIGAEYRDQHYKQTPSDAATSGLIYNFDPNPKYDLERNVYGVFGEFAAPLMKGLEATLSTRYDSYSTIKDSVNNRDFGKNESKVTYKLSARYQPTSAWLIRGSYGTGFKAPDMLNIAQPLVNAGFTASSYNCPFPDQPALCRPGKAQYNEYSGGNENLKPEKSEQFTLGVRFEPTSDLTLGVDFWDVKMKDQVSQVSEQLAFSDPNKYKELFTTYKEPATGDTYWAFKSLSINIGKSHNRGIDFDFTTRHKFDFGTLTGNLMGTHLLKSDYTIPGTDTFTNSMNFFGINNAVSFRNIFTLTGTLETGPFTNVLTARYRNGYTDALATVRNTSTNKNEDIRLEVPSYTVFDWQGIYKVNKAVEVRAGIKNLMDKYPPLTLRNSSGHQVGYDPRYHDAIGRTFYLTGDYKF